MRKTLKKQYKDSKKRADISYAEWLERRVGEGIRTNNNLVIALIICGVLFMVLSIFADKIF